MRPIRWKNSLYFGLIPCHNTSCNFPRVIADTRWSYIHPCCASHCMGSNAVVSIAPDEKWFVKRPPVCDMSFWETGLNLLLVFRLNPIDYVYFFITIFNFLLHEGHICSTVSWATWFTLAHTVEATVSPVGLRSIINCEKAEVLLMRNSCSLSYLSHRNRKNSTMVTFNHLPDHTLCSATGSPQRETQKSVLYDSKVLLTY